MAYQLTDEELAARLEQQQVDRVILNEAARRIRRCEFDRLIHMNAVVEAVHRESLLDKHTTEIVEKLIMGIRAPRRSSGRMSSLAARILNGEAYTERDVRSLAASVLSQDETPGQS